MFKSPCRFCQTPLVHVFADLGVQPVSNDFLSAEDLHHLEPFYPLTTYICEECLLVQLPEIKNREDIFDDTYAYFSSYSDSWLRHCREYVERMTHRFGYDRHSQVIELASNDGYLLQYFKHRGVPVLGVEPCANVAAAAEAKGIPSIVEFFGVDQARRLAAEGIRADLLLGNNVLAHVPDINDFVGGMKILLKEQGVITLEFPHLMQLMDWHQFDTIYHEHYSYLAFSTVERICAVHGLALFDVEELPTHGGSLRIYARHREDGSKPVTERVGELRAREIARGFTGLDHYLDFQARIDATKRSLLRFLIEAKQAGKSIVGYGAPAKGNTLLNYCSIRRDFLDYTVDRSPHKQGKYLPGTHVPIVAPARIHQTRPDYLLILPWNLKDEIIPQMAGIRAWGGKFILPIPSVEVLD